MVGRHRHSALVLMGQTQSRALIAGVLFAWSSPRQSPRPREPTRGPPSSDAPSGNGPFGDPRKRLKSLWSLDDRSSRPQTPLPSRCRDPRKRARDFSQLHYSNDLPKKLRVGAGALDHRELRLQPRGSLMPRVPRILNKSGQGHCNHSGFSGFQPGLGKQLHSRHLLFLSDGSRVPSAAQRMEADADRKMPQFHQEARPLGVGCRPSVGRSVPGVGPSRGAPHAAVRSFAGFPEPDGLFRVCSLPAPTERHPNHELHNMIPVQGEYHDAPKLGSPR